MAFDGKDLAMQPCLKGRNGMFSAFPATPFCRPEASERRLADGIEGKAPKFSVFNFSVKNKTRKYRGDVPRYKKCEETISCFRQLSKHKNLGQKALKEKLESLQIGDRK